MKVITIGRSNQNDIIINDPHVSRTHAQIVISDNGNRSIVDCNSVNGTYVNNKKITGEVTLTPGDTVKIGNTILAWQEIGGQTEPMNSHIRIGGCQVDVCQAPPKKSNTRWYAIWVAILAVICIGAVLFILLRDKKQDALDKENVNTEGYDALQYKGQIDDVDRLQAEADRLQAEADRLYAESLKSQRDNYERERDSKAMEAQKKGKEAERLRALSDSLRNVYESKKLEMSELDNRHKSEIKKKESEIQDKNSELQHKDREIADLHKQIEESEKLRLTEEFQNKIGNMKDDFAKKVCSQLNIKVSKGDSAKKLLTDAFEKGDNLRKKTINQTINRLKQSDAGEQNKTEDKVVEPEKPAEADLTIKEPATVQTEVESNTDEGDE